MQKSARAARRRTDDVQETTRRAIRVLVVDDHQMFAEALEALLEPFDAVEVVGTVSDAECVGGAVEERRPDVVLVDLVLGRSDGVSLLRDLSSRYPHVGLLALSATSQDTAAPRSAAAGAAGFVHKNASVEQLLFAIRKVAAGGRLITPRTGLGRVEQTTEQALVSRLTRRELDVLRLLMGGGDGREIARSLGVRQNTVRTHVQNILMKLGVHSRLEAVALAARAGLFEEGSDQDGAGL